MRQQATHPFGDDGDTCTGAPSGFCFLYVAYNMGAAAYRLEDISDMPDIKTNERLNKAKRLLHVALEQ